MPTAEVMQETTRDHAVEKLEIGCGIVIDGAVTAPSGSHLVIHGLVKGSVRSLGAIEVSKTGQVIGSVEAEDLLVDGCVKQGDSDDGVAVTRHLAVGESGKLIAGPVTYGSLSIARGAHVTGVLHHVEATPSSARQDSGSSVVVLRSALSQEAAHADAGTPPSEFAPEAARVSTANSDHYADLIGNTTRLIMGGAADDSGGSIAEIGEKLEAPLPEPRDEASLPQFLALRPDPAAASVSAPISDRFADLIAEPGGSDV